MDEIDDPASAGSEFAASRELRVRVFPSGEDTWRLDWFGEISYAARTIRSNQPALTVWLSRVADPGWEQSPSALLSPESTAHRERVRREVALGTLVILRIGDLWRDQYLVARPAYETEEFRDLDVTGDGVTIIKAGSSLDDGSFVLPAADHPWHMGATHAYCTQVALADGRFLVIPALELARFYFGSSSALLTRLFSAGFDKEMICEADSFLYEHGGRADLSLAPGIPAASAHDVARLVFGRKAMARASLLSRSCIRAIQAGEPVHPQCVFPFVGKTSLKVKGKWLPRAGQPARTFLVYEILSCAHPFPYSSLTYRQSPATRSKSRASATNSGAHGGATQSGRLNKAEGLHERDPGRQLAGKLLRMPMRERFPDLRFKRVRVDEPVDPEAARSSLQGPLDEEGFAIGDPAGSLRLRPVELAAGAPLERSQQVPPFLRPVLAALRELGCPASVLTVNGEDGWTVPVTDVVGLDALTQHPTLVIEGRPRQLCVLELRDVASLLLLAACEGQPAAVLIMRLAEELEEWREGITMAINGLAESWDKREGDLETPCSGEPAEAERRLVEFIARQLERGATPGVSGDATTLIQYLAQPPI